MEVSIIMPVYNRAGQVREAIDSALAVKDVGIELIVVDDASTDDTWAVLQTIDDRRLRALRMETNSGQSAARNRGLDEAGGAYVKFLDSDDLLFAGHLRSEVDAMKGAEIVVSGWAESGRNDFRRSTAAPRFESIVDDILAGLAVPTTSALYVNRRDWRWDPSLRKIDDWDYFCQAALSATNIATVPGNAYVMRHHAGARATSVTMLANAREFYVILHKIEERLRREGRLTAPRQRRLAQYYYKELRVMSLHDQRAADAELRHIFELDSHFRPNAEERSRMMRILARMIGVRNALRLYSAVKRFTASRTSAPTTR